MPPVSCIRTRNPVSLGRPLPGGDYNSTEARPGFLHETWYHPADAGMGWGQDHLVPMSLGSWSRSMSLASAPVPDANEGIADFC